MNLVIFLDLISKKFKTRDMNFCGICKFENYSSRYIQTVLETRLYEAESIQNQSQYETNFHYQVDLGVPYHRKVHA